MFVVVYDACVLHPAPLRDFLIRIARTGIVRVKWTEQILDECFQSILQRRPDLSPEKLQQTRTLMNAAIPDVLVSDYQSLIAGVELPDPNDRHVVAAAIRAGAQTIVTANMKDFPIDRLRPFGLEAVAPDDFVLNCLDLAPESLVSAVKAQAAALKAPTRTLAEVLQQLKLCGLEQSVAELIRACAV